MANISAEDLKFDVLDRLDNSVLVNQISDAIRKKLQGDIRLKRAINLAYLEFVRDADPQALSQLVSIVALANDPNIGDGIVGSQDGITDGMKVYLWPTAAFQERGDGGVVNVILDEYEYSLEEASPLNSVRMQAGSSFYGPTHRVFAFDLPRKRLYAPSSVVAQGRVISAPTEVADLSAATELKIDKSYTETLSVLALNELLRMGRSLQQDPAVDERE